MNWNEMAVVGRVARAHGRRGEVIVNPDTDFAEERFRAGAVLYVDRDGAATPLRIASVRFQHERPVLGLVGVDTMDAAEALANQELRVPIAELMVLAAGTFYRHDLIGCRVESRTGEAVGVVSGVEGTAGGSRLIVDAGDGEILIPFAAEICTTIDPAGRRIVIDPPEGLLDLNRP